MRGKNLFILFIVLLTAGPFPLAAQTGSGNNSPFELSLGGYLKELGQLSFDNDFSTVHYDNIIHHRIESEWVFSDQLEFQADMRTRLLHGYSIQNTPGISRFYDRDPNYLDLSWVWFETDNSLMHSNIDRLHLSYFKGPWEVHAGRQRINWGRTLVWNPNDLFNAYAFLDFDYEERRGVDALRVQYNWSYASSIETGIRLADRFENMVIAGIARTNWGNYDIQVTGGHYLDFLTLGGGWAGYLGETGFKGEISYFHPENRFFEQSGHFTATAGFDYMFSNSLYLQSELLYNGGYRQSFNPLDELVRPPSADDLFIARSGYFLNGSYPLHPLINASIGFLGSFDRALVIIMPRVSVSITQDMDLLVLSQLLRGSVFRNSIETPNLLFFRFRYSY